MIESKVIQLDHMVVGSISAKCLLGFFSVGIVNVSLQVWHQMNNRRKTLNKKLYDSKEDSLGAKY